MSPRLGRRSWLLGAGAGALTALAPTRHGAAADEVLLEEAKSAYNLVQVTERGSVRTMYFVVDGMRFIESRWDMDHAKSLDLDYARTMMAGFLVSPRPKKFMMMGLGGGLITNYLFERFPDLEIDAVDIDPEVVRLAHKYFGVPDSPRYRTHVGDGRVFIEKSKTQWDQMMLDAFRGVFVPLHLKTREFYTACLEKLTPDGVVVANLHNQTRMYPHDRNTLQDVFPQQYAFVAERGNQTTFVASRRERRVGVYEIRQNAVDHQENFDFDRLRLAARYYYRRDWRTNAEVLHDDFDASELEQGAARHNETCVRNCKYKTR